MGITDGVAGLVTAVVGLLVIDQVIAGTGFSQAILNTIVNNVPILASVGILAYAGMWLTSR